MTRFALLLLFVALAVAASLAHANPPAIVIPGNGAGYDPHAKLLGEIRDEIRGVREELRAMRSGAAVKPGADRKAAREQVTLRACAGCHTPTRVEDGKDGGLLLFNDDESKTLRLLGPREQADATDRVKRGDMPPKPRGPLPPKERELFE